MRDDSDIAAPIPPADDRREWVTPHYAKVQAGDAENGPNPDFPDSAFLFS